jgi:dTDP-glucose 4,6-dehydratase
MVKAIACRNRLYGTGIRVLGLARSESKARAILAEIWERPEVRMVYADMLSGPLPDLHADFIFHCASITSSSYFVRFPVDTIQTILHGTRVVLELARKHKSEGIVFLSSSEIYGVPNPSAETVAEEDSGYLDSMKVRSSYSEGKRMAECLCASYAAQYAVPVKVARLSPTFGPGVLPEDDRVFAQFARSIANKQDITLRTPGETVRNYCYSGDAIAALLLILSKGRIGEAYNVANPATTISIRDIAMMVADKFSGGHTRVVFEIAEDTSELGYNPTVKVVLDSGKLQRLGWVPSVGLEQMFDRTIRSMIMRST